MLITGWSYRDLAQLPTNDRTQPLVGEAWTRKSPMKPSWLVPGTTWKKLEPGFGEYLSGRTWMFWRQLAFVTSFCWQQLENKLAFLWKTVASQQFPPGPAGHAAQCSTSGPWLRSASFTSSSRDALTVGTTKKKATVFILGAVENAGLDYLFSESVRKSDAIWVWPIQALFPLGPVPPNMCFHSVWLAVSGGSKMVSVPSCAQPRHLVESRWSKAILCFR